MSVKHAGFPTPPPDRLSVTTSSTLTNASSALTVDLGGRLGLYAGFDDQTALTGALGLRVLNSKNTNEYRFLWTGNAFVAQANFPNGLGTGEQGVTFDAALEAGDQQAAIFLWSYTSGSVGITLHASDVIPYIFKSPSLGIDGGNPSGFTSESPGSYSVGGKDATTPRIHRTASYDSGGRAIIRPWGPIDWAQGSLPNSNIQATTSKAAGGAGVRHICTGIQAVLVSNNTIAPATVTSAVVLRDGPTANGTIVWAAYMTLPAAVGSNAPPIQLTGLNIRGSANTAMTLEFLAASGASTSQGVSMQGVSLVDG